jgi:small subunit ribosomal protein S8
MTNKKNYQKTTNYPVGDFLVRLKNAAMAKNKSINVLNTKLIKAVANVLKKEGYVSEISENGNTLTVGLAQYKKEPILIDMTLVSRPGLRIYMGVKEIEAIRGPETYIVSTPKGVMSGKEVIKNRVSGEVIAKIL